MGQNLRRDHCHCSFCFTKQNNMFLSLVDLILYFYPRDKHGRPMSHPDYDPRTLLVNVDICDNVSIF